MVQLLALESSGIKSCDSVDELGDEIVRTIRGASVLEGRALLKELVVSVVKAQVECDRQRIRVKEMEAELHKKDALLKAFMSHGASVSDTLGLPRVHRDDNAEADSDTDSRSLSPAPRYSYRLAQAWFLI